MANSGKAEANEWDAYRVTFGKGSKPHQPDARKLQTVYHVVHVPIARRILEDGQLKAGLIYDESRLRTSRISVSWVSANTWGPGSIYGNVQFSFPWETLIEGRRFYWVEPMPDYHPAAYRILLTDSDSVSKKVTPYNPAKDRGPLRFRNGTWYWKSDNTSEFMVEADVSLEECNGFEFIEHNRNICRPYGDRCTDKAADVYRTGGRVLAFLLGNNVHSLDHVLKTTARRRGLISAVDIGADGVKTALGRGENSFGGVIQNPESRRAVMRGALALYGSDQKKEACNLIRLLKSREVFESALREVVEEHFDVAGWTLPDF